VVVSNDRYFIKGRMQRRCHKGGEDWLPPKSMMPIRHIHDIAQIVLAQLFNIQGLVLRKLP
jgi:hypothetical protein